MAVLLCLLLLYSVHIYLNDILLIHFLHIFSESSIFIFADPASCSACNQPDTYENIIDNYCRADFGKTCLILIIYLLILYYSKIYKNR